jgi:hypothetical protein
VRSEAAFAAGRTRFVGGELVSGAGGVGRFAPLAGDLRDKARIHRGEAASLLGSRRRGRFLRVTLRGGPRDVLLVALHGVVVVVHGRVSRLS